MVAYTQVSGSGCTPWSGLCLRGSPLFCLRLAGPGSGIGGFGLRTCQQPPSCLYFALLVDTSELVGNVFAGQLFGVGTAVVYFVYVLGPVPPQRPSIQSIG